MTETHDRDHHLLELIEAPQAEAQAGIDALRESDPAAAEQVLAMRGDRAQLRALPPIDPPVDFLAELEPMIARPMLMDDQPTTASAPTPGAARRAAHRRRWRSQLTQAAVAASVALIVFAGAWISASSIGLFDRGASTTAADDTNPLPRDPELAMNAPNNADGADAAALLAGEHELHHRPPVAADIEQLVAIADTETSSAVPNRTPPPNQTAGTDEPQRPTFATAEFAIVFNQADAPARQVLEAAVAPIADRSAVVRNLTVDELKLIEQAWLARRAASGQPTEPRRAAVDDAPPPSPPAGVGPSQQPVRLNVQMLQESVSQLIEQGLVAGSADIMPDYNRQIEWSQAGLRYTIAVPVQQLSELLAALHRHDPAGHALALRRSLTGDASPIAPNAWATDLPAIRASIDRLQRQQPDAVLLVPVRVVESRSAG